MKTYDNIYYSNKSIYSLDSSKTGLNNNGIVFGSTGSGKSTSIVEPTLTHAENLSYIVPVTKRKIVDKYKPAFKAKGYKVYDLNFTSAKLSDIGINPLRFLKTEKDYIRFADMVISTHDDNPLADKYWTEAATSILAAEIALLKNNNAKRDSKGNLVDITFKHLVEFHSDVKLGSVDGMTVTDCDRLFEIEKSKRPTGIAARGWDQLTKNPIKTSGNIYTMISNNLDKMASDEVLELSTKRKQLDIRRLSEEKSILFITTPPANTYIQTYMNLIYGLMFDELFKHSQQKADYQLDIPVHFICDDFACGSTIPNFANYISYFRASGISVTILLQSLSQLSSLYGAYEAQTIVNNCDTIIYTGGMDIDTCKSMSIRTNTSIDDIMYLPIKDVIVCRRGCKPVFDERYKVFEDEKWIEIENEYNYSLRYEKLDEKIEMEFN